MKKVFLLFTIAICLASCGSDDDEPYINPNQQAISEIAAILNGKFIGSKVNESDGITETHEIIFSPYSSPKKEEWTQYGEYVNIDKEITMYGDCTVSVYYNDHLMEITKQWKYSIDIAYYGAQPILSFYPDFYGRYETHYFTKLSSTSFKLDDITFNKN